VSASSKRVRSVIVGVAIGAAALSSPTAGGPPPAVPHIGVLLPQALASPAEADLRDSFREQGYVEGQSIAIEWRQIGDSIEDARPGAAEFVRSKTDLILVLTTSAARAVMVATSTIPVVFLSGDPVATGLVKSLARPGGNATGVSVVSPEMTAKRLDLLHQLIPHARRIAFWRNPSNANVVLQLAEAQKAARQLGMHLEIFDARNAAEIDTSLHAIRRSGPDAILVASDLGLLTEKERIASSIRKARIPAVFPWREYHRYGALMSYGPNLKEALHLTASYAVKILNGAKPSDLPVQEISRFDLVIDLRVAHELGINVPQELVLRADEVMR
jgi:putative tryptophan/tyrosine transport system substrate-binding protein